MSGVKLSEAQHWALEGLERAGVAGMSPSMLGQHMSERPGIVQRGPGKLNKSQGYGRLGARMASLLRQAGLASTSPAHKTGPTYMRTCITSEGRAALTRSQP